MSWYWSVSIVEVETTRDRMRWFVWYAPVAFPSDFGTGPACDREPICHVDAIDSLVNDGCWHTWVFVDSEEVAGAVAKHISRRAVEAGGYSDDTISEDFVFLGGQMQAHHLDQTDEFVRALEGMGYAPAEYDPADRDDVDADGETYPHLAYGLWLPKSLGICRPEGWWHRIVAAQPKHEGPAH